MSQTRNLLRFFGFLLCCWILIAHLIVSLGLSAGHSFSQPIQEALRPFNLFNASWGMFTHQNFMTDEQRLVYVYSDHRDVVQIKGSHTTYRRAGWNEMIQFLIFDQGNSAYSNAVLTGFARYTCERTPGLVELRFELAQAPIDTILQSDGRFPNIQPQSVASRVCVQ